MYGFNKEEILGKTPAFFSAPGKNDLKTISNYLQKAFNGEPQQFEFWGIRKNGEIFPKFIRLSKGYYFGKKVVNAFALDLTEIKEAGYKIKNAKERLSVANSILRHDITNDLTTISSAIKLYQKKSRPEMLDLIRKRVNMSLDVIETHKRLSESRQLFSEFIEHHSESRNNETHYRCNYQDDDCKNEGRICYRTFDFFRQFITIFVIIRQFTQRLRKISAGLSGQCYRPSQPIEDVREFRNALREICSLLYFLQDFSQNLLKP